jgi:hypothetical protein
VRRSPSSWTWAAEAVGGKRSLLVPAEARAAPTVGIWLARPDRRSPERLESFDGQHHAGGEEEHGGRAQRDGVAAALDKAVAARVEESCSGDLAADEDEVEGAEEERAASRLVLREDRGANGDPEHPGMRAERVRQRPAQEVALWRGGADSCLGCRGGLAQGFHA